MKNKILFATIVIVITAVLASCASRQSSKVGQKSDFFAMNTYVSVFTQEKNSELHKNIEQLTRNYEKLFSSKYDDSHLDNYYSSSDIYSDHNELFVLAHNVAEDTDGAFDYTLGSLTSLWDITGAARVPSDKEISDALSVCRYKNAHIENGKVILDNQNTKIDLGAVAKGYTGDKIKELMKENGIKNGYVSLGGNVCAIGSSENNVKNGKLGWSVAVNNPFDTSEIIGKLDITDATISVSGSYERFFEQDGKIYHHIFDSKTGYPAQSDLVSVAVICENGTLADALSTALFCMGYEKSKQFYSENKYDFQAVFTLSSGKVFVTDGIMDKFSPSYDASKNGQKLEFPQYK